MSEPICTALAFVFCGIACFLAGAFTGFYQGAIALGHAQKKWKQERDDLCKQRKETNAIN